MNNGKKFRKVLNIITLIILFAGLIYTIYNYKKLPDVVATHFNLNGQPNGWGRKGTIFILPIISIIIYSILAILSKYPSIYNFPCKVTYENKERLYNTGQNMITIMNAEIVILFVYIEYNIVKSAIIGELTMSILSIYAVLIILAITIGYYIYKLYKVK